MTGISALGRRAARADGGRTAALRTALSRPVDIGPLIVLRVAFGLLMCAGAVRFMALGWIRDLYVAPRFHFTYYGFGWVRPLPEGGMWLVFIALAGLGLCIAAGLAYRAGMVTFFLLFTYVELLDQTTYLNHYYFISVLSLWLIFLPLNGRYALDNRVGLAPTRATVPAWMVWGVRAQVGLVYFFAGLAKLNDDWLFAAQPLGIWLHARTTTPLIGGFFDYAWVAYAMSWAGAAFDLTIPFWLSWRRTKLPAYGAVIVFHTLTGVLFHIGLFPWIMIACTLVFFDWRLPEASAGSEISLPRPPAAWLPVALLILLALQIALPLRHWLYPGDVNWTEEGGRWAWRVMIVEKTGQVMFFVRDKTTGGESVVFPRDYLTDLQEKQMSFQPDMIAQFAQFLGRDYGGDVEVRARAYVSWNGRPSRLLIDPDYDLLQASLGPRPKTWVLREEH